MLQQATTFNPFMREFILSAQVACRASKHNVADVIRAATRERDNMVSVISGQMFVAPIAFALLPCILLLYLLSSITPAIAFLTSAAFVIVASMLLFMGLVIVLEVFTLCLTVILAIGMMILLQLLFMGLQPSATTRFNSLTVFSLTWVSLLSIFSTFAGLVFFRMGKPISILLRSQANLALATLCVKLIAGFGLIADTTKFVGYNGVHVRTSNVLASRSGVLPTSPEHNNLCPHYSIERGIRP
jgi:hypothetical protein